MSCVLDTGGEDLLGEWLPGDEFSDCCRAGFRVLDELPDGPISCPGTYEINWRR